MIHNRSVTNLILTVPARLGGPPMLPVEMTITPQPKAVMETKGDMIDLMLAEILAAIKPPRAA